MVPQNGGWVQRGARAMPARWRRYIYLVDTCACCMWCVLTVQACARATSPAASACMEHAHAARARRHRAAARCQRADVTLLALVRDFSMCARSRREYHVTPTNHENNMLYDQVYSALKRSFRSCQHRFLKARSTVSNLALLNDFITDVMNKGQ